MHISFFCNKENPLWFQSIFILCDPALLLCTRLFSQLFDYEVTSCVMRSFGGVVLFQEQLFMV